MSMLQAPSRDAVDTLVARGERELLYEEAIRRLILERPGTFMRFEDVTRLPWTEIDFAHDLEHARRNILPRLVSSGATRTRHRIEQYYAAVTRVTS